MSSGKAEHEIQRNISKICEEITNGQGWILLPNVFDQEEIGVAKQGITRKQSEHESSHEKDDDKHNNYSGLTWGLISKGSVFSKMATHPVILSVSRQILGNMCRLSSFAANTVHPGMAGQLPHLDYPYYRHLWPANDECFKFPSATLLSLQIVILLTDFNPENGSTALIPGSQLNPQYPEDKEKFFASATQVEGQAGDVLMFAGSIQHCAMPNHSTLKRSGILQQMVPVFVTPFEDIQGDNKEPNVNIRSLLAMDHPYPIAKEGSLCKGR